MHKKATPAMLALCFFTMHCQPTQREDLKSLQRSAQLWDNVLNKGNLTALDTQLASTCVLMTDNAQIRGVANIKAHYDTLLKAMSGVQFVIDEAFCQNDRIINRWTFTAFHTGKLKGITPTGKKVRCRGASFDRIREGKIVERIEYMDHPGLMRQVQDTLGAK
jgi:predicted ester cyclase